MHFLFIIISSLLILDGTLRFVLLCLRMLLPARGKSVRAEAGKGCVVLIAANEEAGTIGSTVEALVSQLAEWPGSRLWVVADHCTDGTAKEAAQAGANVVTRDDGRLGKGAVIDWWLEQHEGEWRNADAVVILDADSRLTAGSLWALRDAMAAGADAVQAFVAPDASTTAGRLAGWSEVLMQRIDDEARRRCGWPVPLRGTGMALRGDLLAELTPRLHTLAEDLELDVLLAARGARVEFVSGATLIDPKPRQDAGASRQRARWLQGQLHVMRDYRREIRQALFKGGLGAWFLLIPLALRPKLLFIGLRLLLLMAAIFWPPLLGVALAGLAMDAMYYLAGAAIVDTPRQYLLDLLSVPRYAAIWFYSFGIALFRRGQRVWLRAGR